jgi:hypothetical protein
MWMKRALANVALSRRMVRTALLPLQLSSLIKIEVSVTRST